MDGRPCRSQSAGTQCQHQRPGRREGVSVQGGQALGAPPFRAALRERDDVHRHPVQIVVEVHPRFDVPSPVVVEILAPEHVVECFPVYVGEAGARLGVGDDQEEVLGDVRACRRLNGDLQAPLDHLGLHRTRQIEALAHGSGRREYVVEILEGHRSFLLRDPRPLPRKRFLNEYHYRPLRGIGSYSRS